jgi:hypothetical protein
VSFTQTDKETVLTLPAASRDPFYTVIALTMDKPVGGQLKP